MRIAQIIFHEVSSIVAEKDLYQNLTGIYQTSGDISNLIKSWTPEQMLPKLYQDSDLGHFKEYTVD
jgi:hypothetical protein